MVPQPNFDRIARPYRWLEYFTLGRALEHCRLHFLPHLLKQKQALILGDGDGRFLSKLLQQNPTLHAYAVDTSAAMLQLLRQRCEALPPGASARLTTHHANALTVPLDRSYDLIVSHFFLDCLTQPDLETLINRIAPTLYPQALWLVSDFHIPTGLMRLPAKILIRSLYMAFRILTGLRTAKLPDHATPLQQAGLTRIAHQHRLTGLLVTELWQFNPPANKCLRKRSKLFPPGAENRPTIPVCRAPTPSLSPRSSSCLSSCTPRQLCNPASPPTPPMASHSPPASSHTTSMPNSTPVRKPSTPPRPSRTKT